MTPDDEWAVTAHHEAGHVASYLHFCWRFRLVRMHEGADGKVRGKVLAPNGQFTGFQHAICCIAGPLAEERFTGVSL
jgi:hypothetical protein